MPLETKEPVELPVSLVEYIDEWRNKPGNLIMILHRTQEEFGFIPRQVAIRLSQVMDVPLAKIYGVITFYHFFKLKAPGRNQVQVCMGTACYLKGNEDVLDELESLLGISVNSVTDDGEFSIESVRCVGCCGLAPVITVNGEVYGKVSKARLPEILAKHRGHGTEPNA